MSKGLLNIATFNKSDLVFGSHWSPLGPAQHSVRAAFGFPCLFWNKGVVCELLEVCRLELEGNVGHFRIKKQSSQARLCHYRVYACYHTCLFILVPLKNIPGSVCT